MGGSTLPTASTAGYTRLRHASGTFVACECLAAWLPVLERLALARGYIKFNLDIIQLTGGNPLSADTHSKGGAFDLWQFDERIVALCREMGAPATWMRPWTNNHHTHGVLSGCIHNAPAYYQVTAQRAGYNGLGVGGRAGKDTHPDPSTYRTWKQGIAWAEAEIAKIAAAKAAAEKAAADLAKQAELERMKEFVMALSSSQQDTIYAAAQRTLGRDPQRYMAYNKELGRWTSVPEGTPGSRPSPSLDSLDGQTLRNDMNTIRNDIASLAAKQAADTAAILAAIGQIACGGGTPIDINAIREAASAGVADALGEGLDFTVSAAPKAA